MFAIPNMLGFNASVRTNACGLISASWDRIVFDVRCCRPGALVSIKPRSKHVFLLMLCRSIAVVWSHEEKFIGINSRLT